MDCPVPGSGIPAQPKPIYEELFSPLGKKPKTAAESSTVREVRTRVAVGAGQPSTLNGRMGGSAPGGRHPLIGPVVRYDSKPPATDQHTRSLLRSILLPGPILSGQA